LADNYHRGIKSYSKIHEDIDIEKLQIEEIANVEQKEEEFDHLKRCISWYEGHC
jgi:hypothetical protein